MVIGEDIDLIILSLTLSSPNSTIVFQKPGRGKTDTKSYSILNLQNQFKNEIPHFMFIHAIGGCDTTSSIFWQGKLKNLKNVQKHTEIYDSLTLFNNEYSSPEDIERIGEKFLLKLYNASVNIRSLNKHRCKDMKFFEKL